MTSTEPLTVLNQLPPGSAIYSREQIDGGAWEIAWLVREDTGRIQKLGPAPAIEFRAGGIEQSGVLLFPVLVRVGKDHRESIYETWINAHAVGQPNPLDTLLVQPRIVVHLYGDRCELVRTLQVTNLLQPFPRQALDKLSEYPPWSMSAFDRARELTYRDWPDVSALWQALQKGNRQ